MRVTEAPLFARLRTLSETRACPGAVRLTQPEPAGPSIGSWRSRSGQTTRPIRFITEQICPDTESRSYHIMVIVVSGPDRVSECDVFPSLQCTPKREQCQTFCLRQGIPFAAKPVGFTHYVGPRSFWSWENAMAYAMLPADPNITTAQRRHVSRGSSGRWVVVQSHAPRALPGVSKGCPNSVWHDSAPRRKMTRCPECLA